MAKTVIMLVCSAGMSTGLLVSRMAQAAKKRSIDAEIFAVGAAEVSQNLEDRHPNVVLVGPQVRYIADKLQAKVTMPVAVMDMHDYEALAGDQLLSAALATLQKTTVAR